MGREAARRAAAALAVLAATAVDVPAQAAPDLRVAYGDCTEVTALAPAIGLRTVVGVVTFACQDAAVAGRTVGSAAVSEVIALQPDGSFALLRTTTSSRELHLALARIGLPAVLARSISIEAVPGVGTPLRGEVAKVVTSTGTLAVTVGAARAPTEGVAVFDGPALAHHYDGPRGRVTTSYRNTLSGPGGAAGAAAGVVDARDDAEVTKWLGAGVAGASVIAVDGNWTADLELQRRSGA